MKEQKGFKSFPKNFWVVILMEFLERGSYYAMMSILSVFLVLNLKNMIFYMVEHLDQENAKKI